MNSNIPPHSNAQNQVQGHERRGQPLDAEVIRLFEHRVKIMTDSLWNLSNDLQVRSALSRVAFMDAPVETRVQHITDSVVRHSVAQEAVSSEQTAHTTDQAEHLEYIDRLYQEASTAEEQPNVEQPSSSVADSPVEQGSNTDVGAQVYDLDSIGLLRDDVARFASSNPLINADYANPEERKAS